jgi:hypothetical protein
MSVIADHDAVGLEEVGHRGALLEELRAGDVAEVSLGLLAEDPLDGPARADRHGGLHHQRVAVGGGHRAHHRMDRAQVGVARVRRRRAHGDEHQAGALQRVGDVGGEVQPVGVAGDELREAGLVDRDLSAL